MSRINEDIPANDNMIIIPPFQVLKEKLISQQDNTMAEALSDKENAYREFVKKVLRDVIVVTRIRGSSLVLLDLTQYKIFNKTLYLPYTVKNDKFTTLTKEMIKDASLKQKLIWLKDICFVGDYISLHLHRLYFNPEEVQIVTLTDQQRVSALVNLPKSFINPEYDLFVDCLAKGGFFTGITSKIFSHINSLRKLRNELPNIEDLNLNTLILSDNALDSNQATNPQKINYGNPVLSEAEDVHNLILWANVELGIVLEKVDTFRGLLKNLISLKDN